MRNKHKRNRSLDGTVFSTFGKAVPESFGLSFSRSARDNCDTSCRIWDSCYASRIERIYTGLERKLATHYRKGPIWVINRALAQLPDKPLRWARISVDGSLPPRSKFSSPRRWNVFTARLRALVAKAQELGAKWHIPVETMARARSYRAALPGVVIRRTSQARSIRELCRQKDHRSWVVATNGRFHRGAIHRDEAEANHALARANAELVRKTGQTCVVCPAIVSDSLCGQCTACADHRVDVVLYPFHP